MKKTAKNNQDTVNYSEEDMTNEGLSEMLTDLGFTVFVFDENGISRFNDRNKD